MKKITYLLAGFILGIFYLTFCFSFGYADDSKEFTFAWRVFDCLHFCQGAMDYELKESDEFMEMMSDSMTGNNKFEQAKGAIKGYVGDKNEFVNGVAKGMVLGIEVLIDGNNQLIDKMRKISNNDSEIITDFEYTMAQIRTQNKSGWETISMSASFLLPILVESAKDENPKGKIPFKISEEERKSLLKRLDDLFADRLKRYDDYRALEKEGKQGNPDDQTYLIFTVNHIKKILSCESYEEAKEKGL